MKTNSLHHERLYLLGATSLLLVLFTRLYSNLQPTLDRVERAYTTGAAVNLRAGLKPATLRQLLSRGNYLTDPHDVSLVADSLTAKLKQAERSPSGGGPPDNVGTINKRAFAITVPTAWQSPIGGPEFQSRLRLSRQQMGYDSVLYIRELQRPRSYPANAGQGGLTLSGRVQRGGDEPRPMADVLVQLKRHRPTTDEDISIPDELTYARTDADGRFTFAGLQPGAGYSVLPLKPGYEFGSRRGVAQLNRPADYEFTARPHTLRLIGSTVYGQLKDDHAFTVRTPAEFRYSFWLVVGAFLLAFWAVHIFWSFRHFHPDALLLPVLMLLTGLSVLTLLAIQDPLQDTLYGIQAVQGVGLGLLGLTVLSQLNIGRFYTRWWFDPLVNLRSRSTFRLTGWTWLILAVGLALLTLAFGTGPEGSGVQVNLRIGGLLFQPSELTKYLVLLFLAGFFAAHEEQIRTLPDLRWRWRISAGVFVGTGLLMGLYLLLGDMGPALVIGFTFLLFYTIARNTLGITLATGLIYGIALWLLPGWGATLVALAAGIGLLIWRGQARATTSLGWLALVAEGPILLVLVMAAFAFGDLLPLVGDRLAGRKAMWLDPWNNDVYGGDHLAHSYWTLATGGWAGQGLGKGFANAMPAAHTDMMLPSLAEEIGWMGLVSVCLLLFILLHRTLLHARRAGQPFSFYLCAGIALATGVQFLLIAGGSLGLLPLTGISVPFLSYGKVSLIINLTAMGVVFAIASRPGEARQHAYLEQHYDPVLATGIAGFLVGTLVLVGKAADVALVRWDDYIVRPARVVSRNGLPVYSYNPRLDRLTETLSAGTIYDRAGRVLATSSPDTVRRNLPQLRKTGLDAKRITELTQRRVQRYYPFGEHLFFWVGDANTRLFWSQQNGYFAEAAHLSDLRGFNNRPRQNTLLASKYRADRFTPAVARPLTLPVYDYSELAPALRAGLDSRVVAERKSRDRDVYLSVDGGLQVALQKALAESEYNDKRLSVAVLDAATGEVLASAIHPLPNLQKPEEMQLSDRDRLRLPYLVTDRDLALTYPTAPGSTAKILTATAALNKLGIEGAKTSYAISCGEIIRRGQYESEPCGERVDMRKAIVRSSNVYFIRLANDQTLDDQLAALYLATGMNVDYVGGYSFADTHTEVEKKGIRQHWRDSSFVVRRSLYRSTQYPKRYRSEFSGLAWGQGQLTATPASMARMAGAIANRGVMQPSRYVLRRSGQQVALKPGLPLMREPEYADLMRDFMIEQSNPPGRPKISISRVAGKTGTPERVVLGETRNDGWYVFFAPTPNGRSHTVVCVRIELGESSADAVKLANTTLAPILKEKGYLGSF
ncbi:FtsW/RodA/SpoVE family cell cycle protein [Spirosoma taeanense]|uniref:FtsW/RodA/SpoVE family cell cycle protein n=1 Tax=Spirosoma taeanense TaxID=2735870 RepID=A0A6M5YAS6_9BACT|nr:FtsW/RodA/SpoVE family cell cycle protein [Spirosoma taeanense]QJW90323.1 FtsW/RodA/SpoVE family cell cycle protein [Spirosoma taeanense]